MVCSCVYTWITNLVRKVISLALESVSFINQSPTALILLY